MFSVKKDLFIQEKWDQGPVTWDPGLLHETRDPGPSTWDPKVERGTRDLPLGSGTWNPGPYYIETSLLICSDWFLCDGDLRYERVN